MKFLDHPRQNPEERVLLTWNTVVASNAQEHTFDSGTFKVAYFSRAT